MKILFIIPYPVNQSPSQRFRFEQYFEILSRKGFIYEVRSFLPSHNWQLFFNPGNTFTKMVVLVRGFADRFFTLFRVYTFDYVFIHREAAPIGPPVFEWLIARILKKKIIYDFDDAIWATERKSESRLLRLLKWRSKVASICRWSHKISCGNLYLCEYARQFNPNVQFNPTTIDTQKLHNPSAIEIRKNGQELIIGWTGSHSTLPYLFLVEDTLHKIEERFPFVRFLVIANREPGLKLRGLRFIPWNLESEIADLSQMDIGIMPLPDDEWSKGKCGFKALQYMSLEIPVVASPVGVNSTIIRHGENGLLASSLQAWEESLTSLITDAALRKELGKKGRETVTAQYSVLSNSRNFLSLFA
jgi:glycosyltransferase involved in cell wall biosynthesis